MLRNLRVSFVSIFYFPFIFAMREIAKYCLQRNQSNVDRNRRKNQLSYEIQWFIQMNLMRLIVNPASESRTTHDEYSLHPLVKSDKTQHTLKKNLQQI